MAEPFNEAGGTSNLLKGRKHQGERKRNRREITQAIPRSVAGPLWEKRHTTEVTKACGGPHWITGRKELEGRSSRKKLRCPDLKPCTAHCLPEGTELNCSVAG